MSAPHRIVALLLPLLLCTRLADALDDPKAFSRYLSDSWQTEEGLPQNGVQAIAQTRDGYLWLGTPAGLVRFDGVHFTVFKSQFPINNIHALLEDRQGRLWIGTYGAGVYCYEGGRFVGFTTREGLGSDLVRTLFEDHEGTLWVGTQGGGVSFGKDGRFRTLRTEDGLTNNIVRVVYEDREQRLWIGTNAAGLNRWTGAKLIPYVVRPGHLSPYTPADSVSNDNVLAVLQDRKGTLWLGTDGGGLWRVKDGRLELLSPHEAPEMNGVRRLLEDADGDLWIGADGGGLHRLRTGHFDAFTSHDGLPSDIVLSLLEDRERNLWIGTRDGLLRLKQGKFVAYTMKHGLSNDFITAIHGSRDGSLWVGTRAGLDRLANGHAQPLPFRGQIPHDIVISLLEDRSGVLWIGTRSGLFRVEGDRVTSWTTARGLQGNYIGAFAESRDGSIFVGTRTGLDQIKDGHVRRVPLPDQMTIDVLVIHEARDGTLWIGTDGAGLGSLRDGKWRFYGTEDGLAHAAVTALYEEGTSLWIGTRLGLNRWSEGRLRKYTVAEGLAAEQIFSILDDQHGYLWLTSYTGISRLNKKSVVEKDAGHAERLSVTAYSKTDGLKSSECNGAVQPAAWRGNDGRLWFPTVKGLAVIDPVHIPVNSTPPPVLLEQVLVDDESIVLAEATALPPGHKRWEFRYTALSFYAPDKVRFRYKLEGFDAAWIEAGTRRVAYYANIPSGPFRFRVMASNEDGIWNHDGAAFDFSVRAHFYRTKSFWAGSILGLGLLALAFYRLRMRSLRAQFAAVLAERNRIAREIHDTLAQSFVGIGVQLETVAKMSATAPEVARQHLDRARILVRSSLSEARRSVWNLRARALENGDLASALSEVAEQLSGDTEVEVSVCGQRRRLPAEVENNLLRIGQEALANAVRHGQAQSIRVDLNFGDGRVRLSVRDDGRGFDVEAAGHTPPGHFGLAGIRERVHHLGGELSLLSRAGEGAEIIVEVPVL